MTASVFIHGLVAGMNARLMDAGYVNWPDEKVASEVTKFVADQFSGPDILSSKGIAKESAIKMANAIRNVYHNLKNQGYQLDSDFAKQASVLKLEDRAHNTAILCLEKAAEEAASLANKEVNTPENAAKTDSVAALDQQNRATNAHNLGVGKTELDTSAGEVGAEKEASFTLLGGGTPDVTTVPGNVPPAVVQEALGAANKVNELANAATNTGLLGKLAPHKNKLLAAAGLAAAAPAGYLGYKYLTTPEGDTVPVPTQSAEDTPMEVLSSLYDPFDVACEFISKVGSFSPAVKVAAAGLAMQKDFNSMNYILSNVKQAEELCNLVINEQEKTASLSDENFILGLNTIEKVAEGVAAKAKDALNYVKGFTQAHFPGMKDLGEALYDKKMLADYTAAGKLDPAHASQVKKDIMKSLGKAGLKAGLTAGAVGAAGYGAKKLHDKMTEEKTSSVEDKLKSVAGKLPGVKDIKDALYDRKMLKDYSANASKVVDPAHVSQVKKDIATSALKGVGKMLGTAGAVGAAGYGAKKLHDKMTEEKTSSMLAKLKQAADGSLANQDENTLNNAAKTDSVSELDKKNRPEGEYLEGQGETQLNTSSGEVGDEKEVTAEEKEYINQLVKVAEVYGKYLPATATENEKISHIRRLHSLPPGERLEYLSQLK